MAISYFPHNCHDGSDCSQRPIPLQGSSCDLNQCYSAMLRPGVSPGPWPARQRELASLCNLLDNRTPALPPSAVRLAISAHAKYASTINIIAATISIGITTNPSPAPAGEKTRRGAAARAVSE